MSKEQTATEHPMGLQDMLRLRKELDPDAPDMIVVGANAVAPESDADILDDERVDKELHRWQEAIRNKLIDLGAPDHLIDGAGCDSGDPLDFTLAEVGQGAGYFIDQLDEARRVKSLLFEALRKARAAAQIRSDLNERLHGRPTNESWVAEADAALAAAQGESK